MIKFYRSLIITYLFALFGIGALFIRYLIFPFQKNKIKNYETLQKSWQIFISHMEFFKIINLNIDKNIKDVKNSIIVSTHPSFIDIVILMSIIPHSTCLVAKKLSKNPFFKGIVKLLFIVNGENVENLTNNKLLKNELNIIIFPMGGRHRKNEHPKIHRGAALLAQKLNKNIVAINIENDFDFLQNRQPFYNAGDKTVNYRIKLITEINTKEYSNKYSDEVSFRTELTKKIRELLYYGTGS